MTNATPHDDSAPARSDARHEGTEYPPFTAHVWDVLVFGLHWKDSLLIYDA